MSSGIPGSRLDGPGPADLLWRQRFQKQHAHLLERMNGLEEKDAVYDGRTKKAEQAAAACNGATKEIKELKARLKAFEEDEQQQEQNEMASKVLSQQMRDTTILKDKVTRLDGLDSRYRDQEEDLRELRQTVRQMASTVERLTADFKGLQEAGISDALASANANRDVATRLEDFETREQTREQQLREVQARLNAIDMDNKGKTLRSNASGAIQDEGAMLDEAMVLGEPSRLQGQAQWREELEQR